MKKNWWKEEYGFFGKFYMAGDDSIEGYYEDKKMTLNERTKEEVNGVIKLVSLKKGNKILDCPCGYGRNSIQLAKMGFEVVGSDLNSYELDIAKKEADKMKVKVKFVKENMINLKYKEEIDCVVNLDYSFGFFENDSENFKVLVNFFNSLKKGGKFLMHTDVNVPRVLAGKFREFEKRNLSGGGFLRQVEFYNSKTKRNYGVWIIEKYGKVEMKEYSVRVYTKEEFAFMCKKAGFSEVKVYSDWNGKEYTTDSQNMIVVATK